MSPELARRLCPYAVGGGPAATSPKHRESKMAHSDPRSVIFERIMDCHVALNDVLPGPMDAYLQLDRKQQALELLDAYCGIVDSGYLDAGGDVFAGQSVEWDDIYESSYGRVITTLVEQALERIAALVTDAPVPFHKYSPQLSRGDFERLVDVSPDAITRAAAGELTRHALERLLRRFTVEAERPTVAKDATSTTADDFRTVTLLQCAGMVNRQKRTLERWKQYDTDFPTPEIIGENGQADEWKWTTIRPYLMEKLGRDLPQNFPSLNR